MGNQNVEFTNNFKPNAQWNTINGIFLDNYEFPLSGVIIVYDKAIYNF